MPVRVLIVDDHPTLRDVVRDVLELAGCAVREAAGLDEALTALAAKPADVVIASGPEIVSSLRRHQVEARIVAVSNCAGPNCLHCLGADACLSMPFSADALLAALTG
jgi:CheY-like chemotaxis protein